MTGEFIGAFQCRVIRITYNFEKRQGVLEVPSENCCDMDGCIQWFTRIDPFVEAICIYAGDRIDTAYLKTGKEWECRMISHLG